MGRRLAPDEKALWGRVMATVKPLHAVKIEPVTASNLVASKSAKLETSAPNAKAAKQRVAAGSPSRQSAPLKSSKAIESEIAPGHLDATWDRRIHKGAIVPDISVDLHGQGLATAHARLDRTLEQAIHQRLRVVLLVTGHARAHDRASGEGRGAIAAVVRDWLAVSRHAAAISAVRPAHPRHGGAGALYIVLKR